jgi:DNA modification methylase
MKKQLFDDSLLNLELMQSVLKSKGIKEQSEEFINELEKMISQYINDKSKEFKNKSRIVKNDAEKEHVSAELNLTKEQIKKLPSWVKKDIKNAVLIGTSKKVIQTSDGKKYHLDNSLNDLSGGEWTFFLNSVINTRYPTSGEESYAHHIRKVHPSPKPPQLTKLIIEFFTKENELVFDYFMGVGGTLLGASLANREAIGIDLNKDFVEVYKDANKELRLKEQSTIVGDSIEILNDKKKLDKLFKDKKASLILIDPPYGDMMSKKKTGEAVKNNGDTSATPYTSLKTDLGNMDLRQFYSVFQKSVKDSLSILKNKGHIVVFIKDMQPKGKELNLLHADLISSLNEIDGLHYLGTRIWADQGVNLYPYGYPYAYVSNQIHQYILIFKKKNESLDTD